LRLERMGTMHAQRFLLGFAALTAAVLLLGDRAGGGEKKKEPSFAEMMAKFGTPAAEHKNLEPLVGTWHAKVKFYLAPNKPPEESEGTMTRKWIFGKRFVHEEYEGQAAGQPFRGLGLAGYDRTKKKYTGMWVDSMSTAIMTSEGTYDPATKTFTYTSEG